MTLERKIGFLRAGLILQYVALVVYVVFSTAGRARKILPDWFFGLGLSYLIGHNALIALISRKISSNRSSEPQPTPSSISTLAGAVLAFSLGLLAYIAHRTLRGGLPITWAVPAVAFILAFMVLFWSLYRDVLTQRIEGSH